jgi:dienelactone hydrolase
MTSAHNLDEQIRSLDPSILSSEESKHLRTMLRDHLRTRCRVVNRRDREAWSKVKSRDDWEAFCAPRIEALKRSLGTFPAAPGELKAHVTRTIQGEGYGIENLFYESRDGVFVTANLYMPSPPREKMPAIIIVHSHHNPKTQGELQDMGMTWARHGCAVLVMDQLSYGERRQHQPGSRQDYRFRYINGIQLHLIGDSLMGWMVWDIMRGVDILLNRDDVDRDKIIIIGAVAGGGDVAAVTAALDPRITCAIPFNFGGPQPETEYPLPDDAEETFNYMGYGYWESTRNLRLSGRDGFLPWAIVASVAPRYLIYAHEFSWDKERDPVWVRLQKVFSLYDASDNLAFAHGAGLLSGRPPEATHCNNVGPVHRSMIHPALERWFGIPIPQEYQNRLPDEDLICLPALKIRPLHSIYGDTGASRAELASDLRQKWTALLGDTEPESMPAVKSCTSQNSEGVTIQRISLEVEQGIIIPVLGLLPSSEEAHKFPVVIGMAQEGKAAFLKLRSKEIAELLNEGISVYLPDLRGTGETAPGASRERQSEATSISTTEWMLGQTLLGSRLRDVRSILQYLRGRTELDAESIALWGDSFAPENPPGFTDPLMDEGPSPHQFEPLGGLLALFGALYEDDVRAVAARGMIAGYQSILRDRFCYVPHDAIVPGALTAGDLCDVASALAPRPLRLEALVDGRNCLMSDQGTQRIFEPTIQAYRIAEVELSIVSDLSNDLATWLAKSL